MILIVVKFTPKPEYAEKWLDEVAEFTQATRNEPGNMFFEWSTSVDEPGTFVLVEGFTDEGAAPHVNSDHFKKGLETMRPMLASTPRIISHQIDADGFGPMGELQID